MLVKCDSFILLLRDADEIVCCSLPSLAKTIDAMLSLLLSELENVLSEASSGPFLDPRENSDEMVSKLNHMCVHVHSLGVRLEQLSQDSQNLKGELINSQFFNKILMNSSSSMLPIRNISGCDNFDNECKIG